MDLQEIIDLLERLEILPFLEKTDHLEMIYLLEMMDQPYRNNGDIEYWINLISDDVHCETSIRDDEATGNNFPAGHYGHA